MGTSSSKSGKKKEKKKHSCNKHGDNRSENASNQSTPSDTERRIMTKLGLPFHIGPLVLYRQGSMYFDEDGELAHEFYVEVKEGCKCKMKRVYDNLKPQGRVKLPFPRLRNDSPVVLYML